MTRLGWMFALAAAWCAAFAHGAEPIVLDNGARAVFDPVPGSGAVSVVALYRTGYADDPAGLPQAAHLVEHLRCTADAGETQPAGMLQPWTNAETLATVTYYDQSLPAGSARLGMEREAARLARLRITQADVDREIPRIRAEVDAVAMSPGLFVGKFAAMGAVQAWRHGADRVAVRVPDAPSVDRLAPLLERHRVSDLTLFVTGDFDPGEAERDFRELFGPIEPGEPPAPDDESRAPETWPALHRAAWDVPATVVLVALPATDAGCATELTALVSRVAFALQQRPEVRSVVSSGPQIPVGALPAFVGVCLPPDADAASAVEMVHAALDDAARTKPADVRRSAAHLAARVARPEGQALRVQAERLAAMRGMPPHAATAVLMANPVLQAALAPEPGSCSDEELAALFERALARGNRRVLVLSFEP